MGSPVIFRSQSLGLETVQGTPVSPTMRLLGAAKLRIVRPVEQVKLMDGTMTMSDQHLSGKIASLVDYQGPLAFESMPQILVMALDPNPGIVQSSDEETLYHWSFRGKGEGLRAATWDWSDAGIAKRAPYTLLQHMEINAHAPRNWPIEVKMMLVGQKPFSAGAWNQSFPISRRNGSVGAMSRVYINNANEPFGTTRIAGAVRGWKFALNQVVQTYDLHDGTDTWAVASHGQRALACEVEIRRVTQELTEEDSWTGWIRRRVRLRLGASGTIVVVPGTPAEEGQPPPDPPPGGTIGYGYGVAAYGLSPYGSPDWLDPNPGGGGYEEGGGNGGGTPDRIIVTGTKQFLDIDIEGYWAAQDWEEDTSVVSRYTLLPGFQQEKQSDIAVNLMTTTNDLGDS